MSDTVSHNHAVRNAVSVAACGHFWIATSEIVKRCWTLNVCLNSGDIASVVPCYASIARSVAAGVMLLSGPRVRGSVRPSQ